MNSAIDWVNGTAAHWWNYVAHASWQGAVVGAVLLVLVQVFGRRWPAPLRYALLVLALIKFACPPLLPLPTGIFSQFTFTPKNERKPTWTTTLPAERAMHAAEAGGLGLTQPVLLPSPAGKQSTTSPSGAVSRAALLMGVHGVGTVLMAVLIFRRAARLRRLARATRSRLNPGLGEQYRDLAIGFEVYRIPPLAISDQVEAPMAVGVPRPAIMLPARIVNNLPETDLRAVLAHELAHCHRGDLWLNWVQMALLALWWFHPVVWLVNRGLREVREDCCDDLLLARQLVSTDAYCDALLRAAAQLCPALRLNAALGFGSPLHPLGRRMVRIMDWTLRRSESVSPLGAMAVLTAAALVLPGVRSSGLEKPAVVASGPMGPALAQAPTALATLPQAPANPVPIPPQPSAHQASVADEGWPVTQAQAAPTPRSNASQKPPVVAAPVTPVKAVLNARVAARPASEVARGRGRTPVAVPPHVMNPRPVVRVVRVVHVLPVGNGRVAGAYRPVWRPSPPVRVLPFRPMAGPRPAAMPSPHFATHSVSSFNRGARFASAGASP